MSSSKRWWARAGAALTAFVVTMLMPAVVWAESSGVAEAARRRPRGIGVFGFLGALCCLVVVAGIVLVVVLATRRNRRNGGH